MSVQRVRCVVPLGSGQYNGREGVEAVLQGWQLDELCKPHFRKKLGPEQGADETKHLFLI
jgi:hypothetical protein